MSRSRPPSAVLRLATRLAAVLVAVSAAAACGGRADGPPGDGDEILALAASSTHDAVRAAGDAFTARTGVEVRVTTGGSNALASQVLAGVPGDVFLSANERWAEAVSHAGLALAVRPLLGNRLVLVTPPGNPAAVASPADLLGERVRRVALAGEQVPAGLYAEQALRHAGLYDALVAGGRVARGQDVRLTLGFVETGEAEAGVVYATDARASGKVEVVHTFPAGVHDPVVYPLVLLTTSGGRPAARRFFDHLASAEAAAVFAEHGFVPPPASGPGP